MVVEDKTEEEDMNLEDNSVGHALLEGRMVEDTLKVAHTAKDKQFAEEDNMEVVGTLLNCEEGMKNEELVQGSSMSTGCKKIQMEEVLKNEGLEVHVQLPQVELMEHGSTLAYWHWHWHWHWH